MLLYSKISFDFSLISDNAVIIAIVGYVVVFLALLLLFNLFSLVPKLINLNIKNRLRREGKYDCADKVDEELSGDTVAAVATAIYLYLNDLHDEESGVITVKRIDRRYSPWSSKIYSVSNRLNVR